MENQEQNNVEQVHTAISEQPIKKPGLYTAGLILGIVGLCLFFSGWIGLICGILAIIFGAIVYNKGYQNKTPIILGSIATGLAILMLIIYSVIGLKFFNSTKDEINNMFDNLDNAMEKAGEAMDEYKSEQDAKDEEFNQQVEEEKNSITEKAGENTNTKEDVQNMIDDAKDRMNEIFNR